MKINIVNGSENKILWKDNIGGDSATDGLVIDGSNDTALTTNTQSFIAKRLSSIQANWFILYGNV